MVQIKEKQNSKLRVGLTDRGFLVNVDGRGTVKLSPILHRFVVQSFESGFRDPQMTIAVNLSSCEYLDSTFLGCLLSLNRRYNREGEQRFLVVAPAGTRRALLEPNNLDRVLDIVESYHAATSDFVELNSPPLLNSDLGPHVLECHRRLAELDGPNRDAFRSIVNRLDEELTVEVMTRVN